MNDVCMSAAFASFTSNITVYEVQVRVRWKCRLQTMCVLARNNMSQYTHRLQTKLQPYPNLRCVCMMCD